jgi:hypothetical protein
MLANFARGGRVLTVATARCGVCRLRFVSSHDRQAERLGWHSLRVSR